MTNCEVCDQELVEGDFEEKLGICVNCIMIDNRDNSYKSFIIIIMLFLGGFMFIMAFLSIIINFTFLSIDFKANIFYLIPPLIGCIISGSVVIYFSVFFKFR